MKITFAKPKLPEKGVVVAAAHAERALCASAKALDEAMEGGLTRAVQASRFKGNKEQSLTLVAPAPTRLDRIYLVGLGKAEDLDARRLREVGGRIWGALAGTTGDSVTVMVDAVEGCDLQPHEMAVEIASGVRLKSYRFDKYRTKEKDEDKPTLKTVRLHCDGAAKARAAFDVEDKVIDGVFLTRDLVSEPGNVIYPETLAAEARNLAKMGVKVEILTVPQMKKLGMNALLGVGQGSANEPRLAVMRWNGLGDDKARKKKGEGPLAIVGKGVTFDSGGISIKPSSGMEEMKWDMGGAGVVIGLMKALAGRKAKTDVVGVAGLVENLPSGTAQRPGDIVTSMSGQTIEVINTDAEGRLVLADALWYAKNRFKPRAMIDLATLTGAMIICLGNEKAGVFANDDDLAQRLAEAGETVGEPVWRFPLGDEYDRMIKSEAADMKNTGGRGAGSITAAQFLKRFVDDTPWAHLDIAGVAWSNKDRFMAPKGGTGWGVRLLDRMIRDHYEVE